MSESINQNDILAQAEALERLSIKHIQDKNWVALEAMLDPACQFVGSNGSCDRDTAMSLMKGMNLGPVQFKDFKVSYSQDNLIVSFWLAALEYRDGVALSAQYSPRLSVWRRSDEQWKCIAYADLITTA